ncbi:DNA cytosine methyltransferase [Mycetocola zhadangensis]|uniref:DNA cytosine methyltransferase n=1 Tax=Mycetocola zhadangensis TaxID=1164595 RepID=UPI003A4D36A5
MRAVDLFAGCGGMSRGFEEAGVDIVAAFDNWDPAVATYRRNFDHPVYKVDLADVPGITQLLSDEFSPDMIIGGPPCQDFSSAGNRVEMGRADLTVAFAQIVSNVRPKYFVMENVARARNSGAYADARAIFKEAGYGLIETVLDASLYGTPQKRKRFFCMGVLGAPDNFAETRPEDLGADRPMSIRDFFGDSFGLEHYYRHPRNYSRRAVFSVDEPAPTMRGVNRPIPKGYPGHAADSHVLDEHVQALTTAQRARIQTFPSTFAWDGPKTHVEQLIGNAVPVNLAKFVAEYITSYVDASNAKQMEDFNEWLTQHLGLDHRSASDVVSRLRRANGLVPLPAEANERYLNALSASAGFQALGVSIRSQLRRAAILFIQFCEADQQEAA